MKKIKLFGILIALTLGLFVTGCSLSDEEDFDNVTNEAAEEALEEADNDSAMEEIFENESAEDELPAEELSDEELSEEELPEDVSSSEDEIEETYPVGDGASIDFTTVDIYGNEFSTEMLHDAKLVMLNLWEPWCGPCVNEMPDLNQLYLDYKDKGLLIIGSYSTFEMDADAKKVVDKLGISYPIIKCNNSIYDIEQDYVPATYFLDRNGNLIYDEPFAGSDSYSGWESLILEYLE